MYLVWKEGVFILRRRHKVHCLEKIQLKKGDIVVRKEIISNGGGECIRSDVGLKALKLVFW